jgi:hypothetical protein
MRTGILVSAMVLALWPTGLAAQAPEQQIDAALQRAQQVGVPVSLLESRITEGKARGLSLDRIADAVVARLAGLERAQAALEGRADVTEAELGLAGDAVQAGVSEAILAELAKTAQAERRGIAMVALTELVGMGHVPEQALARVMEALQKGPEALADLPAQARERRGRPANIPAARAPLGVPVGGPPAAVPAPGQPTQGGKPDTPRPPIGGRPGSGGGE